jgi:tRNA uridine 5-carboxymethylaminomethyl modification enzyme
VSAFDYDVIVIGGGHAGAEAAWAAANLGARTALVTMDPSKIGAMSCNPAIGGLAKGQMVREIDALGGLMGLAADATGIQFRMLNASKGPAVQGPRAQCDKYRYAREVQRLLGTRERLTVLAGPVERFVVEGGRVMGVVVSGVGCRVSGVGKQSSQQPVGAEAASSGPFCETRNPKPETRLLQARAIVLTTGTFMRGLMHSGERQTEGGRIGEGAAVGISAALAELGFELGRLKTGTPPRLAAETLDLAALPPQPGDAGPVPFSDLTQFPSDFVLSCTPAVLLSHLPSAQRFPVLEQRPCHLTHTNAAIHDLIRANLHRAPMYNGQIQTVGPRYCPSIEDKVVRFADRTSHHVYLEPESLETNEIYCNGISTSLPADVQEFIVHHLPGCERAVILRHGYAVEYDMVWPHQIDVTTMTKRVAGLFLAGQINGTSGYEEAAAQGLLAGLNAVRFIRGQELVTVRRDQAYLGVMMDDLTTKTPREPYRMFTSRAEHRLLLRADNADERLTPLGHELGLVDDARWGVYQARSAARTALCEYLAAHHDSGQRLIDWARRPEIAPAEVIARLDGDPLPVLARDPRLVARVLADLRYAGYVDRQQRDIERLAGQELLRLPLDFDYAKLPGLRKEASLTLARFRPGTLGQAGRLAGVTPADVMVLAVALGTRRM